MKRILVFSLAYFPKPVGGAEVALKEIAERNRDIEFHIVTQRFDTALACEERAGNIVVHRVGAGSGFLAKALYLPRAAHVALRLHRSQPFDAAWAMMSYMTVPLMLMRLGGVRIPYAITLQEGDSYGHVFGRLRVRILMPLLRRAFCNATAISAISNFLAEWARSIGFSGEVRVIPNGVDAARFDASIPQPLIDEVKDELGKKMGDVLLITTSRLVKKNAVDDVISALPLLPENVHFVVLGIGPEETALKRLAQKRGVTERVCFLGHVAHEDLPKYLKAAEIFIRPSRTEGMGNSFIEAFAAGLPVITTQEGGLTDFIFDEKRNPGEPVTAWAVDKDAPEQIADAVKEIMAKPEKVRAVVATARAIAKEKYDWDSIANRMRDELFAPILEK